MPNHHNNNNNNQNTRCDLCKEMQIIILIKFELILAQQDVTSSMGKNHGNF